MLRCHGNDNVSPCLLAPFFFLLLQGVRGLERKKYLPSGMVMTQSPSPTLAPFKILGTHHTRLACLSSCQVRDLNHVAGHMGFVCLTSRPELSPQCLLCTITHHQGLTITAASIIPSLA